MLTSIMIFVGYNLVYGMKAGIDNSAHAGELVSGLIIGYLFYGLQKVGLQKFFGITSVIIALAVSGVYLSSKKNDEAKFYKLIDQFAAYEEQALAPLKNIDHLTKEEFIKQSKELSLPAWNKAGDLLKSAADFKLTAESNKRKELLVQYIQLRIEATNKAIEAETSGDWTETNNLLLKLDAIINELKALDKN